MTKYFYPLSRPGLIQFLVRLCAGVGGLVATSAIVSNLLKNLVDFYCCKRYKIIVFIDIIAMVSLVNIFHFTFRGAKDNMTPLHHQEK